MNARAAELGLTNTHFENACGLDAEGHLSTARDVAMMSREILLHHAEVRNYCSIWMDSLRDGATQLINTNKLLKTYNGITGLKTGTTSRAGVCISASAERNGLRLIAVVLGRIPAKSVLPPPQPCWTTALPIMRTSPRRCLSMHRKPSLSATAPQTKSSLSTARRRAF